MAKRVRRDSNARDRRWRRLRDAGLIAIGIGTAIVVYVALTHETDPPDATGKSPAATVRVAAADTVSRGVARV